MKKQWIYIITGLLCIAFSMGIGLFLKLCLKESKIEVPIVKTNYPSAVALATNEIVPIVISSSTLVVYPYKPLFTEKTNVFYFFGDKKKFDF